MSTLDEDLRAVKAVEDKIITNKVANFAYTDKAYTDNDADSVAEYNVDNEQNIPASAATTLKVNDTVLTKGFRAKASSLTRMLVNHFFGRVSYNLNKVNDSVSNLVNTLISHRGTANGLATLDSDAKVPYSELYIASDTKKGIVKQGVLPDYTKFRAFLDESGDTLMGVTYGNGMFVAVGYSGTILTSSNGATWVKQVEAYSPYPYLRGVTYGNGMFVAVGGRDSVTILTSTDGITWTKRASNTTQNLYGVTYGNGMFVAVGYSGTILTSTDGITWTQRASNTTQILRGVTYGNGMFVAVGFRGTILTSPDCITWTKRASNTTQDLYGVAYGNGLFVAVGYIGTILTSTDGITWTKRASNTTQILRGVTYGNGMFVAVGSGALIITSTDGITWTKRNLILRDDLNSVIYADGMFVAVGGATDNTHRAIISSEFTNAVAIDSEGNMTVPAINSILERLKALEAKA